MVLDCVKAVHKVCVQLANPGGAVANVDDPAEKLLWPGSEAPRILALELSGHRDKFKGTQAIPKPYAHFFSQISNWAKQMENRRDAPRQLQEKLALLREEETRCSLPSAEGDDSPRRPLISVKADVTLVRAKGARADSELEKWR